MGAILYLPIYILNTLRPNMELTVTLSTL